MSDPKRARLKKTRSKAEECKDDLLDPTTLKETWHSSKQPHHNFNDIPLEYTQKDLATKEAAQKIDGFEVFLEEVAHELVYQNDIGEREHAFIREWGYEAFPPQIVQGEADMQLLALRPLSKPPQHPPILAFRGSQQLNDWVGRGGDLDVAEVGHGQFHRNERLIKGKLLELGGKAIVTGHSLGGAIAQITACEFPDSISRIVTFQAPGISQSEVLKLQRHNESQPKNSQVSSTHYRVNGDLAPQAGEAHTAGDVYEFQLAGIEKGNLFAAHMAHPLRELDSHKSHNVLGNILNTRHSCEEGKSQAGILEEVRRQSGLAFLLHRLLLPGTSYEDVSELLQTPAIDEKARKAILSSA